MKKFSVAVLVILSISASPTWADCSSEPGAILSAMRGLGPIRRESDFINRGKPISKEISDFNPPDQLLDTTETLDPKFRSTGIVQVIGKTAWQIIRKPGEPEKPAVEFDGSAYIQDASTYHLPPSDSSPKCQSQGGDLVLIWDAGDADRSIHYSVRVDAKTHIIKTIDGSTTLKDGTVDSEEHTRYSQIAAFTIKPPEDATKPAGPSYNKPEDVDPLVPLPSDAEEILTDTNVHFAFFNSPQSMTDLAAFYRAKFMEMGWKESADTRTEPTQLDATFRSDKFWINVEMRSRDKGTEIKIYGPYPQH